MAFSNRTKSRSTVFILVCKTMLVTNMFTNCVTSTIPIGLLIMSIIDIQRPHRQFLLALASPPALDPRQAQYKPPQPPQNGEFSKILLSCYYFLICSTIKAVATPAATINKNCCTYSLFINRLQTLNHRFIVTIHHRLICSGIKPVINLGPERKMFIAS